jgi:hypothetical protein
VLDELDWTPPFDVDRLLEQISATRGKRISLYPATVREASSSNGRRTS